MFVLLCRKAPNWCGRWWQFGPQGWFERQEHETVCTGTRYHPDDWVVAGPFSVKVTADD